MKNKIEDHVIKCLSKEHGAEIIQYFKDLGVDTLNYEGVHVSFYYGLLDSKFGCYLSSRILKVIELPKKMYSVEEIKSNPKIAILVDSQKDVDKLISIDCFGAFNRNIGFSYLTLPCNKTWNFNVIENDYTIITLNQIKELNMDKEFVLPENWCILRTENNYKKVNEYFNKVFADLYSSDSEYIHNIRELTKHYESRTSLIIYANYTEITTEQFIEYVYNPKFNKTIEKEKELLGYKLIKPEYKEAVNKILNVLGRNVGNDNTVTMPESVQELKKAGVLDLWFEKVCKTKEKVYTLGIDEKFEIVVRDKKVYYGSEDVTETLLALKSQCKRNHDAKIGKYIWNFDGETIVNSVGCISYKSLLSEWLAIDLS